MDHTYYGMYKKNNFWNCKLHGDCSLQTIGHLLLSVMYSTYILVAVALYEEPDLLKRFGAEYEQYVTATPGYIPKICFFTKTKSKQQ